MVLLCCEVKTYDLITSLKECLRWHCLFRKTFFMYSSPESQNENTYKYLMVGFFYGIKNMKQKAVELKHIFFFSYNVVM